MAQTNRGSAQESVSAQLRDLSTGPPIPFDQAAGSVSDNDASEKPVREKLKKTSLASIAKDAVKAQGRKIGDAEEKTCASDPVRREASPERGSCGTAVGSRGRPMRKRSFDDLETPEAEDKSTGAGQDHVKELDGHARKRSRDVRVGDTVKEDARHLTAGSFLEEESEEAASSSNPHELIENEFEGAWGRDEREKLGPPKAGLNADALCIGTNQSVSYTSGTLAQVTAPEPDKNPVDHEMRDSTASPRKKRSRDQLDTEADREQKIHATEEARAHRRSDELERAEGVPSSDQSVVPSGVSFPIEKSRFTAEEKVVPEKADNQEEARDVGILYPSTMKSQMLK